jgi:hypothetical protein
MVVSTPTYHIVSNIHPPEAGGPLQLGTIVDNLQELTPLNEGEEIEVGPDFLSSWRRVEVHVSNGCSHFQRATTLETYFSGA